MIWIIGFGILALTIGSVYWLGNRTLDNSS